MYILLESFILFKYGYNYLTSMYDLRSNADIHKVTSALSFL